MGIRIIAILFFSGQWSGLYGQVLFQKSIKFSHSIVGTCLTQTLDGGVLIGAQASRSGNLGDFHPPVVVKTNAKGEVQWLRTVGGGYGSVEALEPLQDGGSMILTSYLEDVTGMVTTALLRLDNSGNAIWMQGFVDIATGYNHRILLTSDSACIIGASPFPLFKKQSGLIKVDLSGKLIWAVGFTATEPPYIRAMEQLNDGSILCGVTLDGPVGYHAELLRFSSKGEALWSRQFAQKTEITAMTTTSDGSVVVCGIEGSTNFSSTNVFIAKLDSAGNQLWGYSVDAFWSEIPYSITEGGNGDLVISGTRKDSALFIHMDASGSIISVKEYIPYHSLCSPRFITSATNNTYIVTGSVFNTESKSNELLLINLDNHVENCSTKDLLHSVRALNNPGDSLSFVSFNDSVKSYLSSKVSTRDQIFFTSDLCNDPTSVSDGPVRSLDIFPNPITDELRFSINSEPGTILAVELCDNLGRIVQRLFTEVGADQIVILDMTGITAGVYFGELRGKNVNHKFKFLKSGE